MPNGVVLHDKQFVKFISSQKIKQAVAGIAKKITKDFSGKTPVFLSILNGSFMFTADLLKEVNIDCEVSFIKVASYAGTRSSGKTNELIGLNENLNGRTVIILEDIIDSGNTIEDVINQLKKYKPAAVKICTLFFKPQVFTRKYKIDYKGMSIANDFIVGYGLDYDGLGRNLTDIYKLKS